jgi:[ribosomal protein S5]-alanine N-acetyltransferase
MKEMLMQYAYRFPVMTSNRLLFRQIVAADVADLFRNFSNPDLMRYYNQEPYTSIEQAEKLIPHFDLGLREGRFIRWAFCRKEDNQFLGTLGLFTNAQNPYSAELGYEIHPDFQNQGFVSEAVEHVTHFGLQTLHLRRIEARTMLSNAASGRVLEKNKFLHEGILHKQGWWKNELHDVHLYAITSSEPLVAV